MIFEPFIEPADTQEADFKAHQLEERHWDEVMHPKD